MDPLPLQGLEQRAATPQVLKRGGTRRALYRELFPMHMMQTRALHQTKFKYTRDARTKDIIIISGSGAISITF